MIRTGNSTNPLAGQTIALLPGYEFGVITGFIALSPRLENKWALMDIKKADRQLQLPRGGQIHHLGIRAGFGVQSEGPGNLHLGLVDAVSNAPIAVADSAGWLATISATDPAMDNEILEGGGVVEQTSLSRSVLFRDGRTTNAWVPTIFDSINSLISASSSGDLGVSDAVKALYPPGPKLEIALRQGIAGSSGLTILGPGSGGLKQRNSTVSKDYSNKAYFIVDVGYWMRSPEVTTTEDVDGINWERIFANIR